MLKYPKTPYWPYSPTVSERDELVAEPERFVGAPVVVTEKLDGGNTLIHEGETFYAFALRYGDGSFASFRTLVDYARERRMSVVPVLFEGSFRSVDAIRDFMSRAHAAPSVLGGAREGVVIRLAQGFPAAEFGRNVCKSVRQGHVQSDEHWTRHWKPCRIAQAAEDSSKAKAAT